VRQRNPKGQAPACLNYGGGWAKGICAPTDEDVVVAVNVVEVLDELLPPAPPGGGSVDGTPAVDDAGEVADVDVAELFDTLIPPSSPPPGMPSDSLEEWGESLQGDHR